MEIIHRGVLILAVRRETFLHGCFSRFLDWKNGTKSRKVFYLEAIFSKYSEIVVVKIYTAALR